VVSAFMGLVRYMSIAARDMNAHGHALLGCLHRDDWLLRKDHRSFPHFTVVSNYWLERQRCKHPGRRDDPGLLIQPCAVITHPQSVLHLTPKKSSQHWYSTSPNAESELWMNNEPRVRTERNNTLLRVTTTQVLCHGITGLNLTKTSSKDMRRSNLAIFFSTHRIPPCRDSQLCKWIPGFLLEKFARTGQPCAP
jgi:hypothetical protein